MDDIDQNNADLRQHEQVIEGLFADEGYNDEEHLRREVEGGLLNNVSNSPDGIENVDVSDIQMMINKSAEDSSPSPGLEQFNQDMLHGMNFASGMDDDHDGQLGQRQGHSGQ